MYTFKHQVYWKDSYISAFFFFKGGPRLKISLVWNRSAPALKLRESLGSTESSGFEARDKQPVCILSFPYCKGWLSLEKVILPLKAVRIILVFTEKGQNG